MKHLYKLINKKNTLSVIIVVIFTIGILIIASNNDKQQIEKERKALSIEEVQSALSKMQLNVNSLTKNESYDNQEYTGTIPPFTYTADIVKIENNSLYGITSNKDTYSGLMRYDFSKTDIDLSGINVYETYNITCRPLIRDKENGESIVPYVEAISIEHSTQEDKKKLDESKYELSRYIEFKLKYESRPLEDIVKAANTEHYKWADVDILDYQLWIKDLGYTDDMEVVSEVKTIEQLKDEQ